MSKEKFICQLKKEVKHDKDVAPPLPLRGPTSHSVDIKNKLQNIAPECVPYYRAIVTYLNTSGGSRETQNSMTMLNEHLFIGGQEATNLTLLKKNKITHIINTVEGIKPPEQDASENDPYHYDDTQFEYLRFNSNDDESYPIMDHFQNVLDFIEKAREENGKCLIHCVMGVNRSGVLATAYMMVKYNLGPLSAVKMVQTKRTKILTNYAFISKLLIFSKEHGYLEKDSEILFLKQHRMDLKIFPNGMSILENRAPDCIPHYNIIKEVLNKMKVKSQRADPKPSLITEYLYLGSVSHAHNIEMLNRMGISHVINTIEKYSETNFAFYENENIAYMGLTADDDDSYPIQNHVDEVFNFIEVARKNHGKCLIHCAEGVNRSGFLATAYVMLKHKIDPISAVEHVATKRHHILSNGSFIVQLLLLARKEQLLRI